MASANPENVTSNKSLWQRREAAVPRGPFHVTQSFVASAKGAVLTDVDGRDFVDFAGGIGVVGTAHGHPKVLSAIRTQLDNYVHTCFHVMPYEPYIKLAEELNRRTPGDHAKKTVLVNSGAEAVENAVKVARAHTGRAGLISFEHGFHGRTNMGMSLTSKVMPYKRGFGPFAPETAKAPFAYCYRCPFGAKPEGCEVECANALQGMFKNVIDAESVAAIIVEPVLGEGGFVVPPKAFLQRVTEIAKENGIVFIADEVQTAFGRTGHVFASEAFGIVPDLTTSAKAMASGMPISGVTGRAEMMDAPQVGGLGGTYGGNPLSCVSALATMEVIDEEQLCERAVTMGKRIRQRFEEMQDKFQLVGDVRGLGAMMAMELVTDRETKAPATEQTKQIVSYARECGVVFMTAGVYGNVLRLLPPLLMDDDQLERGLDVIEQGLALATKAAA